ncbi:MULTISPECIES: PepSY1/2 domain-containing protein [unclassified Candidatus Frackibacter]|uniref:PepSY1/2 domain-containing protein n=1 Tax=unclassified Candidatus Frackibacter TaxID=2648818 RepID=UPI00087F950B|nr:MULTISPECIES: PepSY1/2 domain-containing protein [unclassified Candidatus Frackibacter]SDC29956.1 spore germination protein [Candidatus Frackibacter sp. WG11]SEM94743.1 spore germination protein [Candidatus Frackibacter sp. WG12]SFL57799.1 spore germination protein [Candidatus Frackibacter sp. WG13]
MKRNFLIFVLVVSLAVVGYWGVKNNRILAQWELQAENQYRSAFQELNTHFESLETEIATALVTKSNERRLVKLNNIWRDAFAAQEDLGELPIAGVSLTNIKSLLSKTERYAYRLSQENINKKLSGKDWENLNQLHKQVKVAANDLEEVHNKIEKNNFRWSKQRHIILEKDNLSDNSVLSSLQVTERKLKLSNLDLGLEQESTDQFLLQLSKVKGQEGSIEKDKAIKLAKDFLGARSKNYKFDLYDNQVKDSGIVTVIANSEETNNSQIFFDISQKSGEVIWFLEKRSFKTSEFEDDQVQKFATDFVKQSNYDDLVVKEISSEGNLGIVDLAPKTEGVLIYPQLVKVKVALDNGDIIGFNARRFLSNNDLEVDLEPKLSLEEAKQRVNQRLDLKDNRLAVIFNDIGRPILSYEFVGVLGDEEFKIYINADNGREVKVIKT